MRTTHNRPVVGSSPTWPTKISVYAQMMVDNNTRGKIINISSQAGRRGEALVSHYCASKAAVLSYTQSAALALSGKGINVNGIAPGVVDTPMWDIVDGLFAKYENRLHGEKKKLLVMKSL